MKITRYIYAYRALDNFILLYPLYAIIFASNGLSPFQISTLFIIWSTTAIITEVPSGVLADRYSRRKLLIIGQLIRAVGYIIWFLVPNYFGYALGFVLWGIGGSFDSGTFQALVYDELKAVGCQKSYAKVIGRAESFSKAAILLSAVAASGGLIFGYDVIYGFSIIAVLASALAISLLPETPRIKKVEEETYVTALRRGVKDALVNPATRTVILLGTFIGGTYGAIDEYYPLFFDEILTNTKLVPTFVAAASLASLTGSLLAHRFEKLSNGIFVTVLAVGGLCLSIAGALAGIPGLLSVALSFLLFQGLTVIYDAKLQHNISSDLRATITSIGGFLAEVVSIAVYLLMGLAANSFGYGGMLVILGLAMAVISVTFAGHSKLLFGRK